MRTVVAVGFATLLAASATAQEPKKPLPKPMAGNLKVGDKAPSFELADVDGKNKVSLADLKGKPVVLVFGSCT